MEIYQRDKFKIDQFIQQFWHVLRQICLTVSLLQRFTICFPLLPTHSQSLSIPFTLKSMSESIQVSHSPQVREQAFLTENLSHLLAIFDGFLFTQLQLLFFLLLFGKINLPWKSSQFAGVGGESVGAGVDAGFTDGAAEGLGEGLILLVGLFVGLMLGSELGLVVGESDGSPLGSKEGWSLGLFEG
jgi:hypothetical protein